MNQPMGNPLLLQTGVLAAIACAGGCTVLGESPVPATRTLGQAPSTVIVRSASISPSRSSRYSPKCRLSILPPSVRTAEQRRPLTVGSHEACASNAATVNLAPRSLAHTHTLPCPAPRAPGTSLARTSRVELLLALGGWSQQRTRVLL